MTTIEEFLESPSTSFEDVTANVLAPGGAKKQDEGEESNVEIDSETDDDDVVVDPAELLEEGAGDVGESDPTAVDSAADVAEAIQLDKDVDSGVVTLAAVESPVVEYSEDEPEPRRRRRRR